MKSLLTIGFTLLAFIGHAQLENRSVSSMGGAVISGGNLESIIVVGDPGASSNVGVAGSTELYAGFIPANFLGSLESSDSISVQDSLALVALYNNAGGTQWTNNEGWLNTPVKDWFGVGVDGSRVVNLNLPSNNLTGFISDSIQGLNELVNIDLSNNNLERDIPAGLGTMQNLRFVNLSNNQLGGFLPDSLGLLVSLTNLDLGGNKLTGTFRPAITNMIALEELDLGGNMLIGTLTDSIGRLSRLVKLDLSSNKLEGELPASFSQLADLKYINVSDNLLEGPLPDLTNWQDIQFVDLSNNSLSGNLNFLTLSDSLVQVNLRNNRFSELPDLSGRSFDQMDVRNNQFDFGDLEPNAGLANFSFAPQDSIGVERDTVVQQGAVVELFYNIGGSNNFYQWTLNGSDIPDATFENYTVSGATIQDDGTYVLEIGNDLFPDFFLYTRPLEFVVSSLQRDQQALEAIYSATNGESLWISKTGWLQGSLEDTDWEGVLLNNDRTAVIGLVLPDNGITGSIPRDFRFMANLDSVDLSGNNISRFPDISRYDLSYLDLSDNNLAFGSLVPNKEAVSDLSNFIYAPQKNYGVSRDSVAQAGDDILINSAVPGKFNEYSWFFDDFADIDENIIPLDASVPFFTINDIDYQKMGNYYAEVTNDELPDLTVNVEPWRVLAKDDIFGTVFADDAGALLTQGEIQLFRITREGRYLAEDTATITNDARYIFEGVVLGDFILKVDPGDDFSDVLQTYFEQQDDWINADTLFLRQKTTGIDVFMVFNPGNFDPALGGTGTIGGFLESEFEEEGTNGERIEARRRVRKAGCSLRRRTGGGGGGRIGQDDNEYELVAYVESDENGNFSFNNIPDGEYRINIQYPGVPMDESTQIDFIIGGNGTTENDSFTIEALITDEGIQVEVIEALGDLKPYLKEVLLYPNPTQGKLRFDYLVYRKMKELRVTLFDMNGVKLIEQELDYTLGTHSAELDLTRLSSGTYILKLQNGNADFTFNTRIAKE